MLRSNSKLSKKVSGRKVSKSKGYKPPHTVWEFKPKLENEAVVLHSILPNYEIEFYNQLVDDVRFLITRLIQNHGFNDGPARYKTIMNYTVCLIEGRNPANPGWLATSEAHRIPSQLGVNFVKLIADSLENTDAALRPKYYQVILTALNIIRMVEGLVDADLRSVTDKAQPIDQELLDQYADYVSTRLDAYRADGNINFFKYRFNLSKNGPNRVPKIESAVLEAHELLSSKLYRPFAIICKELKVDYLLNYLDLITKSPDPQSPGGDNVNGKDVSSNQGYSNLQSDVSHTTRLRVLSKIPDKGCKTRLVAIVDFWSQLVLEPIRAEVQSVIERKFGKTDFRKDQDNGVAAMREFQLRCLNKEIIKRNGKTLHLNPKDLYFYDMSSWTDRFHRDLQKVVMRQLFGPRLAEAWAQLTVHCDWYLPSSNRTVKYGQGQGMGTNGSFDIATLADHLFINFIIDRKMSISGLFPDNTCYGKVGDDLWIYDPDRIIPSYYKQINLPINMTKSKEFVNGHSIAEFCARTFFDGTDVSRISPGVISKSKDFRYIPLLLGICSSRGIQLDASSFKRLNNNIKSSEESYFDKLQDWLASYLVISKWEPSSQWESLDEAYLEEGNWLKGELVKRVCTDAKLQCRILIAHSIVTILDSKEDIEDKLFDLVDAMDEFSDDITSICNPEANLFDPDNPYYAIANDATPGDVLFPKQVIVFGRYVDQRIAIQEEFVELNEGLYNYNDPKDIYNYAIAISKLAQRSCYDQGNINYNTKRVYNTQFAIVNTLNRLTEDYTVLTGCKPEQLRSLWQDLPYDKIADEWDGYLPILDT